MTVFTSTQITYTVDVHVADANSATVGNLTAANVATTTGVQAAGNPAITFSESPVSVVCSSNAARGAYSAMMVLDRSGSMASNDPNNVTLTAAKTFANNLGGGDNMALEAFPMDTAQNRPFECTVYGTAFDANKGGWTATIDTLATPSGGTPLYKCADSAVTYTRSKAINANRAVLLFTDGDDNASGTTTADTVIANANAGSVRLFPIALSLQANIFELGRMARDTGGGIIFADDARQLITAYGTLGGVLSGSRATCKLTMKETISGGTYVSGGSSYRFVGIDVNGYRVSAPVVLPVSWQ